MKKSLLIIVLTGIFFFLACDKEEIKIEKEPDAQESAQKKERSLREPRVLKNSRKRSSITSRRRLLLTSILV